MKRGDASTPEVDQLRMRKRRLEVELRQVTDRALTISTSIRELDERIYIILHPSIVVGG